jgi:hypothetical protein
MGCQSLSLAPGLTGLSDIWRRVVAYGANPDPRVASCNTIALLVASNQPFYPLYVYLAVSPHIAPTFLTFLSTPFFLAVPALSRRSPAFGRALLPLRPPRTISESRSEGVRRRDSGRQDSGSSRTLVSRMG